MVAQLWEHTEAHHTARFKGVSRMVCGLRADKAVPRTRCQAEEAAPLPLMLTPTMADTVQMITARRMMRTIM